MIALSHVHVIPMTGERLLEDHTVVIRGDRIAQIGPADQVSLPSGAQVVDGRGAFLMPGLADMHYHTDQNPLSLTLAVANGVTTVQNFNAMPEDMVMASKTEAGTLFGPRILNGPHALGLPPDADFMAQRVGQVIAPFFSLQGHVDGFRAPYGFQVDAQSARAFVFQAKELGADFIKTNLFVKREAFDAIVQAAGELGLKVQGHVWGDIGLAHYINAGGQVHHVSEIAPYLSANSPQGIPLQRYDMQRVDEKLPELIALMKENGMTFTPTLSLFWVADQHYRDFEGLMSEPQLRYMPQDDVRQWRDPQTNFVFQFFGRGEENATFTKMMLDFQARLIRELQQAHVPILAGTDVTAAPGTVWGLALHRELELLNEYGLSPYETLQCATRLPAEFYDEGHEWGTVQVGRRADLLLLGANPLQDIRNTRDVAGVLLRGRWFSREALQDKLDQILAG